MATTVALQALFLFLFFTTFVTLSYTTTTTTTTTTTIPRGFAMELVHRDSPQSPFHQPYAKLSDRAKLIFESSVSRTRYYRTKLAASTNEFQGTVLADSNGFTYLVNFSIGIPSFQSLSIIDTSCELIWTKCVTCTDCVDQSGPFFDPSKSSTYDIVNCDTPFCDLLPEKFCNHSSQCNYRYFKTDGTINYGEFGTDVFTFTTPDNSPYTVPDVAFGCAHSIGSTVPGLETGMLGLGSYRLSFISQITNQGIEPKFSYCLTNHLNTSFGSKILFGNLAKISGNSTPMVPFRGFYYVTLNDISVGSTRLNIPPGTFDRTPSGGGVIIDSSSTLTFLVPVAFEQVSSALKAMITNLNQIDDPEGFYELCYSGKMINLFGIPTVTFHFLGIDVVLGALNTFLQADEELVCLAMLPSSDGSAFGNMAQQNFNVGFDVDANIITIDPRDCTNA